MSSARKVLVGLIVAGLMSGCGNKDSALDSPSETDLDAQAAKTELYMGFVVDLEPKPMYHASGRPPISKKQLKQRQMKEPPKFYATGGNPTAAKKAKKKNPKKDAAAGGGDPNTGGNPRGQMDTRDTLLRDMLDRYLGGR